MSIVLFNTITNTAIEDAVKHASGICWVHKDNNGHICTENEIGDLGSGKEYALLEEDNPLVVISRKKNDEKMNYVDCNNLSYNEKEERKKLIDLITPKYDSDTLMLPGWLNEWIKSKDAYFKVDRNRVMDGRNLNQDGVKWYLGTYFPKSFTEAYALYSDLFSFKNYANLLRQQDEISILDIGCGTGGNTIGIVSSAIIHLPWVKNIKITACDTCAESINKLKELFTYFQQKIVCKNVNITLSTQDLNLCPNDNNNEGGITIDAFTKKLSSDKYDVIVTFKVINELIRKSNFPIDTYGLFAKSFSPLLSSVGTFTIEDIQEKVNNSYISKLLNKSINDFAKNNDDFSIISPIPCAIAKGNCEKECFSQRCLLLSLDVLDVLDSRSQQITSKHIDTQITYKILARKDVAEKIVSSFDKNSTYQKVFKRPDAIAENTSDHYCPPQKSNINATIKNAFIINQSK